MKRDNGWRIVLVMVVLGLSIWSLVPTIRVFSKPAEPEKPLKDRAREQFKRANPDVAASAVNLGLDLAGGTHIIVEVKKSEVAEEERRDLLDRSLEIIRNRVDQYGLSEPVITKSGDDKIVAELAGLGADEARRLVGSTALLEFKLVTEVDQFSSVLKRLDGYFSRRTGSDTVAGDTAGAAEGIEDIFGRVVQDTVAGAAIVGDTALAAEQDAADTLREPTAAEEFLGNRTFTSLLVSLGRDVGVRESDYERIRELLNSPEVRKLVPPTLQFLWGREVETLDNGDEVRRLYLLKRRPEMTGKYIQDADYSRLTQGMNAGEVEVGLTFKGLGPKEFARVTGANVGRQLAIVLDSVVYSAPVIQGRIANGRASITGIGDMQEAKQLAVTLRAGSLPAPMEIVELRAVGPTLGAENIESGLRAAIIALILVALFMVFYYRGAGLISDLALFFNVVIIFSVLSAFHATLTLPGIAGIVLTIGMAVDANVIIYERIREELRAGKTVRSSIDAGYKKAFSAIFDANITTFGTAAVLYYIGTGPIRGFGLTLMIGIASSLFTALFVTRLLFDLFLSGREADALSLGKGIGFLQNTKFAVVAAGRKFVTGSILVIVASGIAMGVLHQGFNLGIDFTGGHVYQVDFQSEPNQDALRRELEQMGYLGPKVQSIGALTESQVLISLPKSENDSLVREHVKQVVGEQAEIIGEETVGPTIGDQLKQTAGLAFFISLMVIIAYIWLRFGRQGLGFGLGGVVALIHDAIITLFLYTVLGMELSLTFVAAIMTIIGYSLNDSIVIFDRIRELTQSRVSKTSFATKVNDAINQTFSRTIITSFTSVLAVGVLVILGGGSIRDFSIAMLIGFISGVYSTLGIAAPFVVWWERRQALKIAGKA